MQHTIRRWGLAAATALSALTMTGAAPAATVFEGAPAVVAPIPPPDPTADVHGVVGQLHASVPPADDFVPGDATFDAHQTQEDAEYAFDGLVNDLYAPGGPLHGEGLFKDMVDETCNSPEAPDYHIREPFLRDVYMGERTWAKFVVFQVSIHSSTTMCRGARFKVWGDRRHRHCCYSEWHNSKGSAWEPHNPGDNDLIEDSIRCVPGEQKYRTKIAFRYQALNDNGDVVWRHSNDDNNHSANVLHYCPR